MPPTRKTVIKNVHVFNCTEITSPKTVVMDDDVIGDSPDGADETVYGNGGVLMPGLIDAHVHLHHDGHPRQLVKYGVSRALDMAMRPAEKMNLIWAYDCGIVAAGKRADLVLLRGDPVQDTQATLSIVRVWCGGVEADRAMSP